MRKGLSAKQVFCRQDNQNDRFFLPEVELYIYIQFHVRPFLKQLLSPNHRYLLYLNAEIEFVKIIDPEDTMSIFSSVRNARWLTIDRQDDDYLYDIIDQLLVLFLKRYFDDIDNVMKRKGSGWTYNKILQINVTHLKRPPLGIIGYGGRKVTPYNPHLHSAFRLNVIDVNRFLPQDLRSNIASYERQVGVEKNLSLSCVPASIALKFEFIRANGSSRRVKIADIKQTMQHVKYEHLLTPNRGNIVQADFSKLEKLNHGFNQALHERHPFLRPFQGFALNLFKVAHYSTWNIYRLIPIQLSPHWASNDYLQIDLLDSDFAFKQGSTNRHVLLITKFHTLAQSCLFKTQGVRPKPFSCRACLKAHVSMSSHKTHIAGCHDYVKHKQSVLRRVRTNFILHRPTFQGKHNKICKIEKLKFEKRNFFKSLPPFLLGFWDCEASNKVFTMPEEHCNPTPKNAELVQKPIGVSIAFTSPYKMSLPPELERVSVQFFDERHNSLDEFYSSFLLTLRKYLLFSYNFLRETLNRDNGPPDLRNISYSDRLSYLLATHCSFCGLEFNTVVRSGNQTGTQTGNQTGNRFFVRKTRHHNHFISIPNLAKKGGLGKVLTLCQTCNVATFSDGFISKTDLKMYSLNGARYDHLFIADSLARVGTKTFKQYNKDGILVELPILKGEPQVMYRTESNILCLRIRFNCADLANCPYHGIDPGSQKKRNFGRHCPYHRKIAFMDAYLQINAGLDQMLQDVRKSRVNAGLPNELIFPKTHQLLCTQFGFDTSVFELLIAGKCIQPFEKIDSVEYALNMRRPPPKQHFFSRLRGDHIEGKESVSDEEYERFLEIFSALKCQNYLQLLIVYVATDTTLLADTINYYFNYLFNLSGLSPAYFLTNASFALESALFNCKDPLDNSKLLQIELPDKKVHDLYSKALRGGYSFTNSNFCYFRGLELSVDNPVPLERTKNMVYVDVNSLYPSVLSQSHSIGEFTVMNELENADAFHKISEKLKRVDIDFFSAELHENQHIYLFEVELGYNSRAILSKVNCELSLFPFYEKVALTQLTPEQRIRAKRLSRDPAKEPEKLLSYLKQNLKITDYAENLLYLAGFHDVKIQSVKNIVRSKCYPIFRKWLISLQEQRNTQFSDILNRTVKSLANSLAGISIF